MNSNLLAGRYELLQKIGEGGMAVVYKAKCKLLNRYVAVKILKPEYVKDEHFLENFKNESQSAAGLSHPNIVSVYDVGKEGNINYIVMEYVEGKTLSEIIKEQAPMSYKKAINYGEQIAKALNAAHKQRIIHRDIKPHNIIVTEEGVAKITDFGIAKAINEASVIGNTKKIVGSVHYFSPEQARGSYVDERSDLYSLGIVLYEMLTGKLPFDGENAVTVALQHINDPILPPSKVVAGIPPALERLIMKLTEKFQSNRYENAEQVLSELENIDFVTKVVGNGIFVDDEELMKKVERQMNEKDELQKKEEKKTKPKMDQKKKLIIGFSAAGAAIVILSIALLFGMGFFAKEKQVEVPDLTNMTYEEAETVLEEIGLRLKEGDLVESAEVEAGKITLQNPLPKTMVTEGRVITVNISKGKSEEVVPNVVGMDYNDVQRYLESFGYTLGVVEKVENEAEKDTVISQTPEGGSQSSDNKTVNIVVSQGDNLESFTVPSLTGLTLDAAKVAILEAGFKVGNINYKEKEGATPDTVIEQQYAAGSTLKEDSTINIVICKAPPTEPDGGGGTGE